MPRISLPSRRAPRQFMRDEAINFATSERWRLLTVEEGALFQLRQDCLCMPLDRFMDGMNRLLGRPVFLHEFADPDALWTEYLATNPPQYVAAMIDRLERSVMPDQGRK